MSGLGKDLEEGYRDRGTEIESLARLVAEKDSKISVMENGMLELRRFDVASGSILKSLEAKL